MTTLRYLRELAFYWSAALIMAPALMLQCCATAPPAKPVAPPLAAVCIPLDNVTAAQQKAAGDALAGLTTAQQAALLPVVSDWLAMRDADRACLAGH